jgi:hypothetical protein
MFPSSNQMISNVSFLQSDYLYRFLPPIKWSLPFPTSNQMISTVSFLQSDELYRFHPSIRWSLPFRSPIRWSSTSFPNLSLSITSSISSFTSFFCLQCDDPFSFSSLFSVNLLLLSCLNFVRYSDQLTVSFYLSSPIFVRFRLDSLPESLYFRMQPQLWQEVLQITHNRLRTNSGQPIASW